LFEMSSGQRMHTRYIQVGGVMEDIPTGFVEKCRAFCRTMPGRMDDVAAILTKNEIVLARLRDVCPLDAQTLLDYGVTGPLLRAAGNPWDLRKAEPYSSYDDFDFKIPIGAQGDNYDRFAVRLAEVYESVKIIEQALDGLPEGPYITEDRKVRLPPRHELATSMEALIHHFKLVTEGFRVPPGWDRAADLSKDPAAVPDPATTPVPDELRAEIEAFMAKYPDRRSASIPALAAAQRVHGWCSPEAIEQVACVMRLTPGYLIAVAT